MQIRGRTIGPSSPPYVIAEVSCNHAGSEAVAVALIQVAKDAGAEAVKFQFYTPEGMVGDQSIVPPTGYAAARVMTEGPWSGQSMYDLYKSAQMPFEWGPRLKQRCHDLDLAFIASAYEVDGLNWLMEHCVPDALKVASFEATDTPFVEKMGMAGLPLIVSLGMMRPNDWGNLRWPVTIPSAPILLHCVSAYPAPASSANLGDVHWGNVHGFSDHTLGHSVACAAVARGACVLEKHIQLHPSLKTADSHFSATPDEFTAYCKSVREAWEACQPPVGDAEKDSRQFRRALGGKRGSYAS